MTRKSPYKHPVSSYTRGDGKRVDNYDRGEGSKPKERKRKIASQGSSGGAKYDVTFMFPSGPSETYRGSGTATNALTEAMTNLSGVPKSATLRRIT